MKLGRNLHGKYFRQFVPLSRDFAIILQCVSAASIRVDSRVCSLNVVMFLKQKLSWWLFFLGHFFPLPSVRSRWLSPSRDLRSPATAAFLSRGNAASGLSPSQGVWAVLFRWPGLGAGPRSMCLASPRFCHPSCYGHPCVLAKIIGSLWKTGD